MMLGLKGLKKIGKVEKEDAGRKFHIEKAIMCSSM